MILVYLIVVPLAAGLIAWLVGRTNPAASRVVALVGSIALFVLSLVIWFGRGSSTSLLETGQWLYQYRAEWIPQINIGIVLAMDGLSLLLIMLTGVLGIVSVLVSWTEIKERVGLFHFNLMWTLAGIVGVFLALDLFLFYFFWEVMLVPMYFLIAIWGHERRRYASIKFFLFTQLSGLFMLAAILGLAFVHQRSTGSLSFDYFELLGQTMSLSTARWLMLGFLVAFAVKIPMVPLHTWLADAHTEAPTAGSVILAGLLLKTGAYGLIRFVIPLFPEAAHSLAEPLMIIGVVGIIYGAVLAFAQRDLKRLVAYTSISHLGFVVLGVFSFNFAALQGSLMQMICHGFSTGGLFVIVGMIQEKTGTRDMQRLGGLWKTIPRAGGAAMFLAMATLGLPGMGNFVAEFLVLLGTYQTHLILAVIAAAGLVPATIYSLWMIQKTFHGEVTHDWKITDIGPRHVTVLAGMILILIWLGLNPQPVFNTSEPSLRRVPDVSRAEVSSTLGHDDAQWATATQRADLADQSTEEGGADAGQ
jgi:NADH-quinone oxidoreductase subunit M